MDFGRVHETRKGLGLLDTSNLGCGAWIRTKVHSSRGCGPTARRPRKDFYCTDSIPNFHSKFNKKVACSIGHATCSSQRQPTSWAGERPVAAPGNSD